MAHPGIGAVTRAMKLTGGQWFYCCSEWAIAYNLKMPLNKVILVSAFALLLSQFALSAEQPFHPSAINRYSLDGVPRSISIRQGSAWLGYDLERATVLKVWRPADGEVGLSGTFTVKSVGEALFEDQSDHGWTLNGEPVDTRYLGCSEREGHFELRWELRNGERTFQLVERVPKKSADRIWRELKVDGLKDGDSLELPSAAGEAWEMKGKLNSGGWIRITLT